MSGENEQPVTPTAVETTAPATSAETTPAVEATQAALPEFEALLATLPADVQAAYKSHVAGLTSALDKERKANKRRDEQAAKIQADAEAAKLSDIDKAKKQADTLKVERDQLASQLRTINAREALIIAAEKANVEFASPQAQRDALAIALQSAEYDEEGNLTGAEALLKAALKERDYLIKKATTAPAGTTNAAARGSSTTPTMTDEERRETAYRLGIDPRYLTAAMIGR
jgi:small-conductance mechanosensitive channel